MTDQPLHVLFVCTANMCRSPLAAAVFKAQATRRDLPVRVASAGLLESGVAAHDHTIAAMAEWDVDVSGKLSRQIEPSILQGSDLIIGMSCRHTRRLIGEDPGSKSKVFLFRELVGLAAKVGPRQIASGQTPHDWVAALQPARSLDYKENAPAFEVPDPIGLDAPVYVALRDEFLGYTDALLNALFPVS